MQKLCIVSFLLVLPAAAAQQYVAFDAASASSTYSVGNLAGSPAFAAQQTLSGGSGYWCSSGSHAVGQSVTWTGILNSRRVALGVKVSWAYAPGEVKVLTSSDGANFEEVKCWQSSSRKEVAFDESFMFDAPQNVKAVTITMRHAQSWGYFGINSAALIAEPGTFMLASGITSSAGEQCIVTGTSGIQMESCLEAIAAGDGREVMQFDKGGQIVNVAGGTCLALADGDTAGGGVLAMEPCSISTDLGDGRTVFALTPSGQLKMPRVGNYCVSFAGEGAAGADISRGADVDATSSNPQHDAKNIVDGDAQSYWASGSDPAAQVDVQLDFGAAKQIKTIEIEWEHPAQAFELQVASRGKWTSVYATSANNLQRTTYLGPVVSGSALRIRMTRPHPTLGNSGGHALYGIKNVRVLGASARAVVQDCVEAEDNTDARDKFFMVAVPEFDPRAASAAKQSASLLRASEEKLGNLLAELYMAMPSLAACGFKASFSKHLVAMSFRKQTLPRVGGSTKGQDDVAKAVASVAPALGVDMQALRELVTSTHEALAQISR